jgi:integrase
MASIVRREKSKYFTACFTNREGRQLKRSTKTTDKKQAMQIAIELERVEHQARQGNLTSAQLRKVLNDVSEKVTGDTLVAPTVAAYLTEWLAGIEEKNAEGTHERYSNAVKHFLTQLKEKAQRPITAITPRDVELYLTWRLKQGVASKTAIVDMKVLNSAFRRAETYGVILKNPVKPVQLPKSESSEREVFTNAEVQKILDAAPSLEWQTLILLGYFIGGRLGDCVQMKWENVSVDNGTIVYEQKKTGKKVVVPMHYHVIEHLKFLSTFGTEGFLAPKLALKGSGGKHGLSEGFSRILKLAKIDPMTIQGKGVRKFSRRTFHSLRHSFNSALANAGIAEEVRMKLTGHSSKEMNARYTHLQVATLKNAVTSLPLFGQTGK